jgi:hypothetical protein
MLFTNTVDKRVYQLIKKLQSAPDLNSFFIVGVTALALQIGHRKSVDIDLFPRRIPCQFSGENAEI